MNIVEYYRKKAIEDLFKIPTFQRCWEVWESQIKASLGDNFTENDILSLGDRLTDIFRSTGEGGRGQDSLSTGGTAWEALVCYYINLCTANSRIVALRRMSLVPKHIQDAITVNYSNFPCNTESDITILVFPNLDEYVNNVETVLFNGERLMTDRLNINCLNSLVSRDFTRFEIGIIQCKTNWNDNAQIPMLWDMIYSAGGFRGRNITIGRNNYSIQNCSNFTYSFVTVPSNAKVQYNANNVAVKRVYNLSGGNYWGKPTENNVCRSLREIFNNNYSSGFDKGGIRSCLNGVIGEFNEEGIYNYFKLY